MVLERNFLHKAPPTNVARILWLNRVRVLPVKLQRTLPVETLAAQFTTERSLLGVSYGVVRQFVLRDETFRALLAVEIFLLGVTLFVDGQISLEPEVLSTQVANVGFLLGMGQHVSR